jgi:hypothetical protein
MHPESVLGCRSVVLIRRDARIRIEEDYVKLNRGYSTDGIYLRGLNLFIKTMSF